MEEKILFIFLLTVKLERRHWCQFHAKSHFKVAKLTTLVLGAIHFQQNEMEKKHVLILMIKHAHEVLKIRQHNPYWSARQGSDCGQCTRRGVSVGDDRRKLCNLGHARPEIGSINQPFSQGTGRCVL